MRFFKVKDTVGRRIDVPQTSTNAVVFCVVGGFLDGVAA